MPHTARPAKTTIPATIQAAIDFGISNTDVVALINGQWRRWHRPYSGTPDAEQVRAILAAGGVDLTTLPRLAVTGGRHRLLPQAIEQTALVGINELTAIGRGGQAVAGFVDQAGATPLMVVSAGSGTAVVRAEGDSYAHVSGTAVGGGTMLGLARLLLHTVDPLEIDQLAQEGDANGVDLSLADVVTGPIGTLPANATAVNFGRLARQAFTPRRQDIATGIVTLVGQTIGLIAINAARAQRVERIVVTGHMTDMTSIRNVLQSVASFYHAAIELPTEAGYATAMGALLAAAEQENK
jgi:type II pantothenate kinase